MRVHFLVSVFRRYPSLQSHPLSSQYCGQTRLVKLMLRLAQVLPQGFPQPLCALGSPPQLAKPVEENVHNVFALATFKNAEF